jgi:predicted dehydrogenase
MVGAGRIAQTYAQAFKTVVHAELVAVADTRLDAADALASGMNCRSFDTHQRMAEEAELDAVIICTPPATHAEVGCYFLDRKLHVLCEKPLSIDSASARLMLSTARANGVLLTMSSKFRYVDDVVRAKSVMASGLIGDVIHFENTFAAHVDMGNRWNCNPSISGGGVLIDNGTHSVDIMRYFLGPIAEVYVVDGKRIQGLPVDETVHMVVRTTTGVTGSVDLSWTINKDASYISIYGSRGTISIGWTESKYREVSRSEWVVFGNGYDKIQAFRSLIDNFALAACGEQQLLISAEDALASVSVIESAYRSLRQNRWMSINRKPELAIVAGA